MNVGEVIGCKRCNHFKVCKWQHGFCNNDLRILLGMDEVLTFSCSHFDPKPMIEFHKDENGNICSKLLDETNAKSDDFESIFEE